MTDRSLFEKLHCMVRVAPEERKCHNSWSGCEKNLLTTEQKLFAISHGFVKNDLREIRVVKQDKGGKWKKLCKKWIERCPWMLPWTVITLSAIQLFLNIFNTSDSTYQLLAFSSSTKFQIWRFFTYSLLHAGTTHLIINMILQLVISLPLETEVGHLKTLYVYIGGVLSGSLAASLTDDGFLMVGASSGIYSLLMSHISHILMNHEKVAYKIHRIVAIVVLTLSDVIHSITHCLLNNNVEPRIHIAAHVAGALSGVLLGFIFFHHSSSRKGYIYAKWSSIALFMTYIIVVFVIIFNKS